ncbi:MAG: hypothetical protein UW81_C0007G0010 [Candidatus Giovannonibacteria bacterium GW2011_GWC2_44_9]|uniref:Uncharacterized protein n=2 Tax=Candidatus Giovannoniibacteriota TaxID=1752738 RepID=A0A0G1IVS7_9BACT|nr:MAG: hypothetical protein UW57_C0006G0018 [Candidatus Giovannonibacteria bacterium GW2011_GWA1_44_29]KKT84015.1 MAG: hypothetical protein UW81_C0007G0010 [Candidatus Giovannonibacteria bacterium GW2011_GWC2_44_9]KKT91279.1 MAG: hypothetical protein UW93_C0009G0010 [Parcubacteria group bacterium GW2011_GWC1_45_13]KKU29802.1 MAG: hypothetical protein UX43_C0005G0010 [Candidatus Giovannonibacteria bacterium GW2011_GWB1_46_20]
MLKSTRLVLVPALIISLLAPSFAAAALPPLPSNLPSKESLLQFKLNKPFGGKITKIQACMTPPGFILHIGPPMGGEYFLNPATSKIHAFGVIQPGVWTLGNAAPVPINCSKGNPAGIGGFSMGGLLGNAVSNGLLQVNPIEFVNIAGAGTNIATNVIKGVEIVGPAGGLIVTGVLGETFSGLSGALSGLSGFLPGIGIISSLASGDFFGSALTLASLFDPTGITAIASLIFNLLGINFGKKPPSLGSAYPIIHIGTSEAPAF